MMRTITFIAAAATAAIAMSPASAQYGSYGQVQVSSPTISYTANPGPYGGTAPVPYAYGYGGGPYGGGLVTGNVALYGSSYGNEYGGPFSGPFRTDSAPLTGGGR